jgi:hypothetical protein
MTETRTDSVTRLLIELTSGKHAAVDALLHVETKSAASSKAKPSKPGREQREKVFGLRMKFSPHRN